MYNLPEYSKNYRKTTGSLFNNYRDEPNSGAVGNCCAFNIFKQFLENTRHTIN